MAHDDTPAPAGTGTRTRTAEDATPEAVGAPEPEPRTGGGLRARVRCPRVLPALLLVLALLAASVTLLLQVLHDRETDRLRTEATDTARDYAVALSSFDYESLDANRDVIAARSTPEFAGKYNQMVDALRQIVTDGKGKATATVEHVGVESLDTGRAVVLVFADQQATNAVSPQGNTQKYRMVVSLVRDGDRWLVDDVDTR
ncbi:hypothetical protein GCM10023094_02570 [Rhodococcus olei]|uniref:Mce-associated membrane protein n=1 Tax=Rhodococcus olei TaxID=2161675 RepID=A0ABP8NRG3_9NOCA